MIQLVQLQITAKNVNDCIQNCSYCDGAIRTPQTSLSGAAGLACTYLMLAHI